MDEIVFEPSDVNMLAALGIVESVKLFPFMLSMGELQYACDSEYRCKQFVNCLSEYYPDSQIEARQLWSKYHGTANAVQCDMINHLITFNYKEGTQTITFEEAAQAASKENGSDLDCFTAPRKAHTHCVWVFLYCRRRFLPAGSVHFQKLRSLKSYCKKVKLLYNRACAPVCAGTVLG